MDRQSRTRRGASRSARQDFLSAVNMEVTRPLSLVTGAWVAPSLGDGYGLPHNDVRFWPSVSTVQSDCWVPSRRVMTSRLPS